MPAAHDGLGDLFRAFALLEPRDTATERAITAMLHLAPPADLEPGDRPLEHGVTLAPASAALEARPDPVIRAPRPVRASAVVDRPEASGTVYPRLINTPEPSRLSTVRPDWLSDAPPFPPRARTQGTSRPVPLFRPHQQRAILAAALATRSDDGPLDAGAALRTLSQGRPLARLPRLPIPTLRRGVQVLVDLSAAMDPYAGDVEQVTEAIRDVVGRPRVQVFGFVGVPREVYATDGHERVPWRPPQAGTPVVVVSGFGIGGPLVNFESPSPADWLELSRRARAARCPLVGLVPFAPSRWHPAVARAMTLVHWDRWMTAGAVRRVVGRGHPVE